LGLAQIYLQIEIIE